MSAPTDGQLGTAAAVRLVAGREISTRLRTKAFIWTTALFVAAVVLGGVLLHAIGGQDDDGVPVAFTPSATAAIPAFEATATGLGATVQTSELDPAAGEQALTDGDVDVLVTSVDPMLSVTVDSAVPQQLQPVLAAFAQQLALASAVTDLGGDPADVAEQVATAAPEVTALDPEPARDGGQIVAGYLAGILLFISLMTAGQLVAQGVVEEKSSRVVELLLATLRPAQLMAGKVLGIGVVGLIQVGLVVGSGAATASVLGLLDSSALDLGTTALWALAWFVVGFATYALVLGALGALVSRQEDVGSVIGPVTTLMIIPYVIGVSILPWDPTNALATWLSYVPFCAPMLMPIRIALGAATTAEALLALAISLAIIPALVWLAGRIYAGAVLHSGGRMKIRDALRGT
ncbi:ABC transporter permease [Cellulomonas composti]|uniref:ABC transporter permease n=1 Tax=Cellulomonas composti TaxID=266130 RepID=A0A511JBZ6_9CELL|nr:ABC transporter permease [Cellulomonas composti]GEL95233.1 ABC transporter permease [Cellulomonas composti]